MTAGLPTLPPPERAAPVGVLAVAMTASATAALTIMPSDAPTVVFLALLVAGMAGVVILMSGRATATLRTSPWLVVAGSVVLLGVAVGVSPRDARDAGTYAMYGRIVSQHDANPYERAPSDFSGDHYLAESDPRQRHDRTVHGPVFTATSAAITAMAGDDDALARRAFQLLSAFAVLAVLILLAKRTRDAAAVALVGLNPVTASVVVNNGHNDPLVGLAALGGSALASTHPAVAGLVLGIGASIKPIGMLALLALGVWVWFRSGRAAAARLLVSGIGVVVVAYALAGGVDAIRPIWEARGTTASHTIWGAFSFGGTENMLVFALIAVVTGVLVTTFARSGRAEETAGAGVAPYLVGAPFILPSYSWWALPTVAVMWRRSLAWIVVLQGVFLMSVYPDRTPRAAGVADRVLDYMREGVAPALQGLAVAFLLVTAIAALGKARAAQRRAGITSEA